MLVLSRREGESIQIGANITIRVLQIDKGRNQVRIGIDAPKEIGISRTDNRKDDPDHGWNA